MTWRTLCWLLDVCPVCEQTTPGHRVACRPLGPERRTGGWIGWALVAAGAALTWISR